MAGMKDFSKSDMVLEGTVNIGSEEKLPRHDLDSSSSHCTFYSKEKDSKDSEVSNVPAASSNFVDNYERLDGRISKEEMGETRKKLYSWLNKQMKIEMTDGRVLVGIFLCTDRDANVILGSCTEYLNPEVCGFCDEPRILGLVMVPGRHIVSIHHDASDAQLLILPQEKD